MTRISLLAMGGTISMSPTTAGAVPSIGAADFAATLAGSLDVELEARDVLRTPSRAIAPEDMWLLAEAVRAEIDGGADGIVVTHGTDTLEETAYALAMLVDTPVPLVLTGSMRLASALGADGPANLAAAVAVARQPEFAAYGPLIVFQDEIHAARWATKAHSVRVAAFASPSAGPLGYVVEGRGVAVLGPTPMRDRLPRIAPPSKRVEVLLAYAGADGLIVDAIAERIDGLVIAGTGGGHVNPRLVDSLERLVQRGVPVVLTSRSMDGQVLRATYGGPGSETQLLGSGLRSAGSLSPVKARLRLGFGLSAGLSAEELFPDGI